MHGAVWVVSSCFFELLDCSSGFTPHTKNLPSQYSECQLEDSKIINHLDTGVHIQHRVQMIRMGIYEVDETDCCLYAV